MAEGRSEGQEIVNGRVVPSAITANPAMRDHFKTGQVSRAQDLQLF
jgi:hypothetical protein